MIEEISCDTRYDHHIDKRIELCARLNLQDIIQLESESGLGSSTLFLTIDRMFQRSVETQVSRDRDTITTSDISDDSILLIVLFAVLESGTATETKLH